MTMALSSYWSTILSWFTPSTTAGTNTSSAKRRTNSVRTLPADLNFPVPVENRKDALTPGLRSEPGTRSERELEPEYEYEMYDVGTSSGVSTARNGGIGASKVRERTSGHGRSHSESAATTSNRPRSEAQRAERAYNTLPRSRGQKTHTAHSRASSYAPVVVIPGIVNSSFLLFSPDVRGTGTVRRKVQQMQPIATRSELEKREAEHEREREREREREERYEGEGDGETSESGSGSPRSRSSFDSFGSSDSQSSYTSYGTQSTSTTNSPDEDRACALSHRGAPYTISSL